MKNDNKEVDFGIIENAGLTELESLSGKVPPAGSDEKKQILEMSRRKYDIRKNDNADYNEDTVSGSEPYRPRKLWKIISSAAACIALVGSIAGGAALLHRNSRIPAADTETITDHDVTTETETASATGESTECHQVFLRKGNRPDSPVVLTGNYIKKAEMQYMVDANGESQYVISVELDEEGTEIFAKNTEELEVLGIPFSIWIDGESICAPMLTSAVAGGKFLISGNFDQDTASELARKLSSGNIAYDQINDDQTDDDQTGDDQKKGTDYTELIGQCLDEFINNADDSITDAFYCEYDIDGDDVPELFIQYFTNDPQSPYTTVCELYNLQYGKYQKLAISSRGICVHHDNRDGIIISQSIEDCDKHQIYQLNDDGSTTHLYEFRIVVENDTIFYTINGEKISAEEWDKEFRNIMPDDVEWLDELTKDFYHRY